MMTKYRLAVCGLIATLTGGLGIGLSAAETRCLPSEAFLSDVDGEIENECAIRIGELTPDLVFGTLKLIIEGEEGTVFGVGVRAGGDVLISDQCVLVGDYREVVLDITRLLQIAESENLSTLDIVVGPSVVDAEGAFMLQDIVGCLGTLNFFRANWGGSDEGAKSRNPKRPAESVVGTPPAFAIHVAPNPTNPGTTFFLEVPPNSGVALAIYDLRGHCIWKQIVGENHGGKIQLEWHGDDVRGWQVPTGIYLYRVSIGVLPPLTGKLCVVR